MAKILPLHNNVLIRRGKSEEKTPSGLIIPSNAAAKSREAEVLAVGPGKTTYAGALIPVSVQPGDIVLIEQHARSEVKLEEDDLMLISEDDIVGVLEK
jgi:chaperonin GroES